MEAGKKYVFSWTVFFSSGGLIGYAIKLHMHYQYTATVSAYCEWYECNYIFDTWTDYSFLAIESGKCSTKGMWKKTHLHWDSKEKNSRSTTHHNREYTKINLFESFCVCVIGAERSQCDATRYLSFFLRWILRLMNYLFHFDFNIWIS